MYGGTERDYKILYEATLAAHQKSLELIVEKDDQIRALSFELDKYKKIFIRQKNEKLANGHSGPDQNVHFELGIVPQQQEELSQEAVAIIKKAPAKSVKKQQAAWCFRKIFGVKSSSLSLLRTLQVVS